MWHLYLHPSINKSSWSKEEDDRLKTIALKYNLQNWNAIASELGTKRSELMVCKHYMRNLLDKYKMGDFTYEEDKKLLETVNKNKNGHMISWGTVAKQFPNRSKAQLYHHYSYYLSQDSKKKGVFTKAEDIILMIYVDRFGRKFSNIVKYLPHRSAVQCKGRYANSLERGVQKGKWTLDDDETILDHVQKHGTQSWKSLSLVLMRTRGQLRQRYHRLKQFLEQKPNARLLDMKRSSSGFGDPNRYSFCRYVRFFHDLISFFTRCGCFLYKNGIGKL